MKRRPNQTLCEVFTQEEKKKLQAGCGAAKLRPVKMNQPDHHAIFRPKAISGFGDSVEPGDTFFYRDSFRMMSIHPVDSELMVLVSVDTKNASNPELVASSVRSRTVERFAVGEFGGFTRRIVKL